MSDTPEFASKLEKEVYELLLKQGFPPETIIYEPSILPIGSGRAYRPDFLIVDPQSGEYLAIIEVKAKYSALSNAREQLDRYKQAHGNQNIKTFVITGAEDIPSQLWVSLLNNRLHSENEGTVSEAVEEKEVDARLFPKFQALKAESDAGIKADIRSKREQTTNTLQRTGIIVAIILLSFVIADFILSFWNIKLLTTERLSVLGVVIAMVLIPYLQKFKGLGLEWELVTKETTKEKSKNGQSA